MKQRTKRRITSWAPGRDLIGPRCKSFCLGCSACAAYHHLDTFGRFPYTFEELDEYNQKLQAS